jgi:hypothetical protein
MLSEREKQEQFYAEFGNNLYRKSNNLVTIPSSSDIFNVVTETINPTQITSGKIFGNVNVTKGFLQSEGFVTGVSGWRIDADGKAEFESGYFRGDITGASGTFTGTITATTGTIGGWTILSDTIFASSGIVGLLSTTTAGDDIRIWAGNASPDIAPFRVYESGALYATGATISGAITITSGSGIASLSDAGDLATADTADFATQVSGAQKPANNATVGATWGTNLSGIPAMLGAPSGAGLYLSSTYMGYYSGSVWNSYIDSSGNFYFKGDTNSSIDWNITTASTLTIKGKVVAGTGSSLDGQYLTAGSVASASANLAMRGWTFNGTFSSTDADTVSWTGPGVGNVSTFTPSGGSAYSAIVAGNTGNMSALTYIYFDSATPTVLSTTTTAATAVGDGKVLIAVAQNQTSRATFQVFGGSGGNTMLVDNLVANALSTNEFISNSAQIADATITSAKVISLVADKITAGTGIVNSLSVLSTLTMGSAATNGTIQSYGWNGTANGFQILGGATPSITLIGGTITAPVIQTATSGIRTTLNQVSGYDYGVVSYDANSNITHILGPKGSTYTHCYDDGGWGNSNMVEYQARSMTNANGSPTIMVLHDQAIITDGGTQTHNGYNFGVLTYAPLTLGNGTKTGTGTLVLHRGWYINDFTSDGDLGGNDFIGTNYGVTAKSYKVEIDGTGSPNTFKWSDDGGSTWVATGVSVKAGPSAGNSETGPSTGNLLTSTDGSYVRIYFNATTGGASGDYWTFTSGAYSASTNPVGLFTQYQKNNTAEVLYLGQVSPTSTNYYKTIKSVTPSGSNYVWTGNGTTPNGLLTGTSGDICINGDGGKIYYCTGTTNWIGVGTSYKNGTTTYDMATATGTQNIAHGLGGIPNKIRITGLKGLDINGTETNVLSYNGTTASCVRRSYANSTAFDSVGSTLLFIGTSNTNYVTGTVTVDSTNIIISWVKTGDVTGTIQIMWEAE